MGLKCGGSDGISGITANPLVGLVSDWLIAQGGTTVLTEVPEMFGAETILMARAAARGVFDGTVSLRLIASKDISMQLWKLKSIKDEFSNVYGRKLRIEHLRGTSS